MDNLFLIGIACIFGWVFLILIEIYKKRSQKKVKVIKYLPVKTSTQLRIEKTQKRYASILNGTREETRKIQKKPLSAVNQAKMRTNDIKSIKKEVIKLAQQMGSFIKSTKNPKKPKIVKCFNCNWVTTEEVLICENCGENL